MRALSPTTTNPYTIFHSSFLALQSTIDATLSALTRPPRLISQIHNAKKTVEKNFSSISRSTRWPLGLLDDTRQRLNEEREERARQGQTEVANLSRELRYTQQTVAMELAGWQDMHERMGRRAIRELARGMVVVEKMRLEGMRRALRQLSEVQVVDGGGAGAGVLRDGDVHEGGDENVGVGVGVGYSALSPPIALAGLEMANRETGIAADLPHAPDPGSISPTAPVLEGLLGGSGAEPSGQTADELASGQPGQSPRRNNLFGEDDGGSARG